MLTNDETRALAHSVASLIEDLAELHHHLVRIGLDSISDERLVRIAAALHVAASPLRRCLAETKNSAPSDIVDIGDLGVQRFPTEERKTL